MTLLTVAQCKDYLRIEHTAEDAMLATWLAMALAQVEAELGRPITAAARTWRDDACTHRMYGAVTRLVVPVTPMDVTTLVIVDTDSTTLVAGTDYRAPLTGWEGVVEAMPGVTFAAGPYTLTADVGLTIASQYASLVEPAINAAALDIVADRWHRRNPTASSESAGGGVSTSYTASGIPIRAAQLLAPWKAVTI